MARIYRRDKRGRFSSGGGGSGPKVRPGQEARGLARASKSAMEDRRIAASGAFRPGSRAKIDRTNKIAADAQAFYGSGKGRRVAPAAPSATTARRKPLTGVNETVGRNLAGFKGLPVSTRSPKAAAESYGKRARATAKKAGGGGGRFTRGVTRQGNLLTGRTDRTNAGSFRRK